MTPKNNHRSPVTTKAAMNLNRAGRGEEGHDASSHHRDDDGRATFVAGRLDLYRKNTKGGKRRCGGGGNGNGSSSSVTLRSFFAPKVTNKVVGVKRLRVGDSEAGVDDDDEEEEASKSTLPAVAAAANRSGSMGSSPRHAAEESRGRETTETSSVSVTEEEESRTLPPSSSALHESQPLAAAPHGDGHGGKRRRRTGGRMQQLYLDFGQADFARRIICTKCGMLYVHGLAEDAASHESVCRDYRHGVSVGKWKRARVVKRFADASRVGERIVEVRPSDAIAYRQTVAKVKSIVDQEMGFVSHSIREDDIDDYCVPPPQTQHTERTAFLYVSSKNKVIGFCTTQLITRAYHLQRPPAPTLDANGVVADPDATVSTTELDDEAANHPRQSSSSSLTRSQVPTGATLGVHQIWTHSDHRGRGVATALLDAARANVVFGSRVPLDMVAFSSPTGDGVELARRYVGGGCGGVLEDVKVYDC